MVTVATLRCWLAAQDANAEVGIDDGGLALQMKDNNGHVLIVGRLPAGPGVDLLRLQTLLEAAAEAKDDYWAAAREVEHLIGLDFDEMDLCTDDAVDMSAEDLMKSVAHYHREEVK